MVSVETQRKAKEFPGLDVGFHEKTTQARGSSSGQESHQVSPGNGSNR